MRSAPGTTCPHARSASTSRAPPNTDPPRSSPPCCAADAPARSCAPNCTSTNALVCSALLTSTSARDIPSPFHTPAPRFTAIHEVEPAWPPTPPPMTQRLEKRPVAGDPPFSSSPHAITVGWLRLLDDDRPLDPELITTFCDAWWPPILATMDRPGSRRLPARRFSSLRPSARLPRRGVPRGVRWRAACRRCPLARRPGADGAGLRAGGGR